MIKEDFKYCYRYNRGNPIITLDKNMFNGFPIVRCCENGKICWKIDEGKIIIEFNKLLNDAYNDYMYKLREKKLKNILWKTIQK